VVRVFVAGASGVIGRQLLPLLVAAGHDVTGMTRRPDRVRAIVEAGAWPWVGDVFDRDGLIAAMVAEDPDVVIHQLTDLATPPGQPIGEAELERNARIREEGTANLVAAAVAAGVGRFIAQSIAWLYAPAAEPHVEEDPLVALDPDGGPPTRRGVHELERQVLRDPRFDGVVLRYGRLYGPGTWTERPAEPPTVHVVAAARAAALAVERGAPGVYNIVEPGGPVSPAKAMRDLGWPP
jgi:nucleoside-diphosphate-sugar epimerase